MYRLQIRPSLSGEYQCTIFPQHIRITDHTQNRIRTDHRHPTDGIETKSQSASCTASIRLWIHLWVTCAEYFRKMADSILQTLDRRRIGTLLRCKHPGRTFFPVERQRNIV